MKKLFFLSLILLSSAMIVSAQQTKIAAPTQFTKAELLAFSDMKALLSAINKGQDYSKYMVRNFNLTTIITNADGTTTKLSEMGPGGAWSEKQKAMIEKYASKGVVFTLEGITMVEKGKKGIVNQPNASFAVKE